MTETDYTARDITVLEGLEPVRLRPGMYIGSTGLRGLHHLIYEVVDNSVDEALQGRNDRIEVTLHPDHSVTVQDWGSGIPVDVMKDQGLPALTVVLTKLHAGGKFGGDGYKVSGGLHGVGVSVVNALSERLVAEVRRDGQVHRQEFERGDPTGDMEVVGKMSKDDPTGTTIIFLPDSEIFEELDVEASTITQRLRETAFLTKGLHIKLVDERADGKTVEFHYEGGIRDFVSYINEAKDAIHKHIVYFEGETDQGTVEVAMQWNALVPGVRLHLRQQHQHRRGRHAPLRLPQRADAHAEREGAGAQAPEGEGEPRRRGRPRRARGRRLGQAPQPAVRGPDEDEARQPGHRGSRPDDRQRVARRGSSRRTRRTRARSATRRSLRCAPGSPRARRAS